MVGGGVLYLAEAATDVVVGVPDWITKLGLPIAMLLLTIVGLVSLFKALSAERAARIKDRDTTIEQLRADQKEAQTSRQQLIDATRDQSNEFSKLTDAIRSMLEEHRRSK
jgi:septal ring factor EnvC (AmiA/AmiB activator)